MLYNEFDSYYKITYLLTYSKKFSILEQVRQMEINPETSLTTTYR